MLTSHLLNIFYVICSCSTISGFFELSEYSIRQIICCCCCCSLSMALRACQFSSGKKGTDYLYICVSRGQSWRSRTKCDCKTDWLWVRSPLEEMKYLLKLIFPFLRSGVKAKRGVEFCHSTRNASRIRQKVGNGVS